jgi:hypothetical protein
MLGYQNILGLNSPQNYKAIKDWINKYKLSIVGLFETKIASINMRGVETIINPLTLQFLSNVLDIVDCHILVSFLDHVVYSVSLIHYSLQWITCEVSNLVERCFFVITFFIAPIHMRGIRHYGIICQDTPLHFGLDRDLF